MSTTTTAMGIEGSAGREMTRDLGSILSGPEKRLLIWMAERTPPSVNSDHLTALGLAGMLGAGLSFWAASLEPLALCGVVLFLAVNWLGDSLDGTLARVRRCQRPKYGYYVDHVVDVFGTFFLLGGLALSGYMSAGVAFGLMIAFFMTAAEVFLAAYAVGTFRIHFLRMGPTELRILFALGTLYVLFRPTLSFVGESRLLFDVGGVFAIAGLFIALVASSIRNTKILYEAEPLDAPLR